MTDVSSWSPIDESNTAAPPDGWPEFMMPSGVNNCGRMMMGAIRRMYDSQVNGSLVLPYLKLSGGTVSGAVTVTGAVSAGYLYSSGAANIAGALRAATVNADAYWMGSHVIIDAAIGGTDLHDNAGQWVVSLNSDGNSYYANNVHRFANRGNTANFLIIDGNGLSMAVGSIATPGNVTASGNMSAGGQITAGGALQSNRGDAYALYAPNGGLTCALDISGRNIYANGSVNITNGSVNISGSGGVGGGDLTVAQVLYAHDVMPSVDNVSICGGAASAWNVVEAYNFITKSDAALKADLGPLPDTLTLVAAVAPQAFRYEGEDARRHWGFVAQDVRAAVSSYPVDLVSGEEGHLGLDYGGLTAMLWKAVQELNARLTALEGR